MTETKEHAAVVVIDKGLKDISGRNLVSSSEMTDLLLDIRALFDKKNAASPN